MRGQYDVLAIGAHPDDIDVIANTCPPRDSLTGPGRPAKRWPPASHKRSSGSTSAIAGWSVLGSALKLASASMLAPNSARGTESFSRSVASEVSHRPYLAADQSLDDS